MQVHLEGNSSTRRAPQGAVGGWTLRMRGHPSLHGMGDRVDRTFPPAPGFLSLRHGLVTAHTSRASPELPSEQRSQSGAPSLLCGPAGRGQSPGQGGISRAGGGGRRSGQGWGLQGNVCPLPCVPGRGSGLRTIKASPFRNHLPKEDWL